jgi:hypothetical protein
MVGEVAKKAASQIVHRFGGNNKMWGMVSRIVAAAIRTFIDRDGKMQHNLNPLGGR